MPRQIPCPRKRQNGPCTEIYLISTGSDSRLQAQLLSAIRPWGLISRTVLCCKLHATHWRNQELSLMIVFATAVNTTTPVWVSLLHSESLLQLFVVHRENISQWKTLATTMRHKNKGRCLWMKKDKWTSSNCGWVARATANQVTARVRRCPVSKPPQSRLLLRERRQVSEEAKNEGNTARMYRSY
jgi:hypothetical protein